ncbi:hypothetical protein Tco_1144475, partial [Tanacetum coccineum]
IHDREKCDDRNLFNRLRHRRKSVHERLSDTYSPMQQNPGQAGRTQETPLTVEVIPSVGNISKLKTASGASKNRMAILTLRGPGPSIEIDLVTKIDSAA